MRPRRERTRAELVALLDRAGLEVVGQWGWGPENVLTPAAAWRPVISYETVPTATVREDRPDLVPALNAQWHRLAREHGVIDEKGEFLIHIGDDDAWVRVRLALPGTSRASSVTVPDSPSSSPSRWTGTRCWA